MALDFDGGATTALRRQQTSDREVIGTGKARHNCPIGRVLDINERYSRMIRARRERHASKPSSTPDERA